MYESKLTRQALPEREYRELLGTALCVFNSNTSFVIENILHSNSSYDWYKLIDQEAGRLCKPIEATISMRAGDEILNLFKIIIEQRNRIVHSFQITDNDGEQRLATKTKIEDGNEQFIITEKYLKDFIKLNENLCLKLHQYRDNLAQAI